MSRVSTPSTVMRAVVDLVEAHQQVHERGLAGARRADDRDGLAGLHLEVQVLDERLVGLVAEATRPRGAMWPVDVGERTGVGGVRLLLGLVEQLEDALGGGDRRLHARWRCWRAA